MEAYVDEVMDLVELTAIRGAIVSTFLDELPLEKHSSLKHRSS